MKSSRKLSDARSFPSTLMERGTSGRRLTAAFRKASAVGVERRREKRGREAGSEVTRKQQAREVTWRERKEGEKTE